MNTLTQLCLAELAKQYVDTDNKEEITQALPPQLVHRFIEELQPHLLKPVTELVHSWENHIDSWCYCTEDVGWTKEFTEVAVDMLKFVHNPRKRLQEEKESWDEWRREVLPKINKHSSVSEQRITTTNTNHEQATNNAEQQTSTTTIDNA